MAEKNNGRWWLKIAIPIVAGLVISVIGGGFKYAISRADKNSEKIADLQNTVNERFVSKDRYEQDMAYIKKKLDFLIELQLKEKNK